MNKNLLLAKKAILLSKQLYVATAASMQQWADMYNFLDYINNKPIGLRYNHPNFDFMKIEIDVLNTSSLDIDELYKNRTRYFQTPDLSLLFVSKDSSGKETVVKVKKDFYFLVSFDFTKIKLYDIDLEDMEKEDIDAVSSFLKACLENKKEWQEELKIEKEDTKQLTMF